MDVETCMTIMANHAKWFVLVGHVGSSKSFRLWTFALMPFWRHLDLSCLHVDHSNIDQGRQSASRHPQIFMPFNLISTSFRSFERILFKVFIFCSFQYMIQVLPHWESSGFHACAKKSYLGNYCFRNPNAPGQQKLVGLRVESGNKNTSYTSC